MISFGRLLNLCSSPPLLSNTRRGNVQRISLVDYSWFIIFVFRFAAACLLFSQRSHSTRRCGSANCWSQIHEFIINHKHENRNKKQFRSTDRAKLKSVTLISSFARETNIIFDKSSTPLSPPSTHVRFSRKIPQIQSEPKSSSPTYYSFAMMIICWKIEIDCRRRMKMIEIISRVLTKHVELFVDEWRLITSRADYCSDSVQGSNNKVGDGTLTQIASRTNYTLSRCEWMNQYATAHTVRPIEREPRREGQSETDREREEWKAKSDKIHSPLRFSFAFSVWHCVRNWDFTSCDSLTCLKAYFYSNLFGMVGALIMCDAELSAYVLCINKGDASRESGVRGGGNSEMRSLERRFSVVRHVIHKREHFKSCVHWKLITRSTSVLHLSQTHAWTRAGGLTANVKSSSTCAYVSRVRM